MVEQQATVRTMTITIKTVVDVSLSNRFLPFLFVTQVAVLMRDVLY